MRTKTYESELAYTNGGYREKYAMDNGNRSVRFMNGKKYWVFTYNKFRDYQDANGAMYCVTERRWVG